MSCKACGEDRALVDDLCDNCTVKSSGELLPWLGGEKENTMIPPKRLNGMDLEPDELEIIGWEQFVEWATNYGVGDSEPDYLPWLECWMESRRSQSMTLNRKMNKDGQ